VANVSNLAVFNSKTKQYKNIALPKSLSENLLVTPWRKTHLSENGLANSHCSQRRCLL
jgi:hypothetical protein